MATRIRVKRGTSSQITGYTGPHYVGELAYATDTEAFYVSNGTSFIPVGGSSETPTLQSVTDAGNTTTNAISVGTVTANNELHLVNSQMRIFRSSDDMRIRTGNSDRMTITSTGNVGIGTTSPIEKLHVSGNVLATGGTVTAFASNTSKAIISNVSGGGRLQLISDEGDIYLRTKGGDSYFNAGNVGIGTASPTSKLQISTSGTDSTTSAFSVQNGNGITTFEVNDGSQAFVEKELYIGDNYDRDSRLYLGSRGAYLSGYYQEIQASPSFFAPTISSIDLRVQSVNQNYNGSFLKILGQGNGYYSQSLGGIYWSEKGRESTHIGAKIEAHTETIYSATEAPTRLMISTTPAGSLTPTERMRITSDGNVGIGTSASLYYPLTIEPNGTSNYIELRGSRNAGLYAAGKGLLAFDTSQNFIVYTGGINERMRVTSAGNVGIGTTAPSEKLEVVGYAKASTGFKIGNYNLINSGGDGLNINSSAYYPLRFLTNNAERMRISEAGNVSIGTTAPVEKVHINGNLRIGLIGNTGYYISWGQNEVGSTGDFARIQGIRTSGAGNQAGHLTFQTKPPLSGNSPTERLRITDTGNVGIGTTSPAEKLEVAGNIKTTSGNLFNYNANTIGEIRGNANTYNNFDLVYGASWDGSNWIDTLGAYQSHKLTIGTGGMMFSTGSGQAGGYPVSYTERFRISNTGNVGIGTTAPAEKLEVAGNIKLRTGDYLKSATRTNILLDRPTDARMVFNTLYQGSTTGGYDFTTGSTSRMLITGDGNVGIGTTAPTQKLDVSGTIKVNTEGHQIALYRGDGSTLVGRLSYTGTTLRIQGNDGIRFEDTNGSTIHGVITDAGNFGIGITSPSAKLHVAGEIRVNAGQPIMFDVANSIYAVAAQNQFRLYSGGNPEFNITTAGNVGIGTISPTSKTHINGTAMAQLRLEQQGGPLTNTDTKGQVGDIAYDDLYFYIKTTNGWGRVPLDFGF